MNPLETLVAGKQEEQQPANPLQALITTEDTSVSPIIDLSDELSFAFFQGFGDTYKGVKQIFGVDEEEMAAEHRRLEKLMNHPEHGGSIKAAYFAGLVGDPVGWVIPGMKAKSVASAVKFGMGTGFITGVTGYVPEDMTRAETTLYGIAGGGILSPAMFKTQHTLFPAFKKTWGNKVVPRIDEVGDQLKNSLKGTKTGNTLGRWFVDNYGLPESYVKGKQLRRQTKEQYLAKFDDLIKKHGDLTPEEDALLYRIITGEESKIPANLSKLSKQNRKLVDDLGQEMVDLGLLDKATYTQNKGKYLYRSYEKTSDPDVKKLVRDERKIKLAGAELMRRGKTVTISEKDIPQYKRLGFKQITTKHPKHHTVMMNRDWTKEERTKMGEVISSAYAMAKTGKLMTNDIANFKFFDSISKDPSVVWKPATKGEKLPAGYKIIPNTGIEGTKLKVFGNLAGKAVPENVYNDLMFSEALRKFRSSTLGRFHTNMLSWWKRTKTSLNPVVHTNNVMSNVVLYDLVDANYKHIPGAAKSMFKRDDIFKQANSLGIFNADMMSQELTALERNIFRQYMKTKKPDSGVAVIKDAWNKTKSFKEYLNKTHLDDLYQAEDNVFRLALFKDRLAKGDTANEAATFARKYMLDYEINAPGVQIMRETAFPFLAYTYRAAPIILETMKERPWKIAKWGLTLSAMNQLGVDVSNDDIKRDRKIQKELSQGFDLFGPLGETVGAHTMVRLPTEDKQYLDVSRWIPAGDVLDTSSHGTAIPGVPAPLQPTGAAYGGVWKAATGFDTFTGRSVPGVGSGSIVDEIDGRVNVLMNEFLPATHSVRRISLAASRDNTHPSKDDLSLGQAVLNSIGVKVKPFDERKQATRVGYKYKKKLDSLKSKVNKLMGNYAAGAIEQETFRSEIERIQKEVNKITHKLQEVVSY